MALVGPSCSCQLRTARSGSWSRWRSDIPNLTQIYFNWYHGYSVRGNTYIWRHRIYHMRRCLQPTMLLQPYLILYLLWIHSFVLFPFEIAISSAVPVACSWCSKLYFQLDVYRDRPSIGQLEIKPDNNCYTPVGHGFGWLVPPVLPSSSSISLTTMYSRS